MKNNVKPSIVNKKLCSKFYAKENFFENKILVKIEILIKKMFSQKKCLKQNFGQKIRNFGQNKYFHQIFQMFAKTKFWTKNHKFSAK